MMKLHPLEMTRKSIATVLFIFTSMAFISTVNANPAEYYVGNYQAVGYDKQTSTPYILDIRIEKNKAHFLEVRYRHNGIYYLGYLDKSVSDDSSHFILKSHQKKEPQKTNTSYCNYLHNAASMSAEINCHGSLIGNNGYFSLVMQ